MDNQGLPKPPTRSNDLMKSEFFVYEIVDYQIEYLMVSKALF